MILLASTSDILRVVTGSAANITVHASWVDDASGSITPGRTNTAAITTATTTTVVGSPSSSVQRTVEHLALRNTSNSTATTVRVEHYDGTTAAPLTPTLTLLPGESLIFDEHGRWKHLQAAGGAYLADVTAMRPVLGPWLAETCPREFSTETATTLFTSGGVYCQAIFLRAGMVVSNISYFTGGTAATTPTHWQFGLYDAAYGLKCASIDQTTTAVPANTLTTLAMSAAYTVTRTGIYYVALTLTASAMASWKTFSLTDASMLSPVAGLPALSGAPSGSGGILPASMSGSSGSTTLIWAAVS